MNALPILGPAAPFSGVAWPERLVAIAGIAIVAGMLLPAPGRAPARPEATTDQVKRWMDAPMPTHNADEPAVVHPGLQGRDMAHGGSQQPQPQVHPAVLHSPVG